MKKLTIPILAVLAILQSCTPTSKNLVADETAKKIFNTTELKGIEKTISFVDSIILDNTNATDINQGYHAYFDKLKPYILEGKIYPALVKDTVKFKFLETLDEEAFAAIWRMDENVGKVRYKDTILTDLHGFKWLELNYQAKYLIYLKEIGESDNWYAGLYKSIEITGDISPSFSTWFPMHHQDFDFTLFKNRLWAAVLLLRMGEPFDESVERYLKEKI